MEKLEPITKEPKEENANGDVKCFWDEKRQIHVIAIYALRHWVHVQDVEVPLTSKEISMYMREAWYD